MRWNEKKKTIKTVPTEGPLIIEFSAKCSDLFGGTLTVGDEGFDLDGYVPRDIGIGGGDYVELKIDLRTGQILNWKPPSGAAIKEAINGDDYDEFEEEDEDEYPQPEADDGCSVVLVPEVGVQNFTDLPQQSGISSGSMIALYQKVCADHNGGSPPSDDRGVMDWIEEINIAGMSLVVIGPSNDPAFTDLHTSVSCLNRDGSGYVWFVSLGSSWSNIYVKDEHLDFFQQSCKALRAQGYRYE